MEADQTEIVQNILCLIDAEIAVHSSGLISNKRARQALINVRAQIFNNYAADEMLPEVEDE